MSNNQTCLLLDEYLNETLDTITREQFVAHLSNCSACTEEITDWLKISQSLQFVSQSMSLADSDRTALTAQVIQVGSEIRQSPTRWLIALAASALLAGTIAVSWFFSGSNQEVAGNSSVGSARNTVISNSLTNNAPIFNAPIFAHAQFDEQTLAVLEFDDDELTVYRVFPKVTLRPLE